MRSCWGGLDLTNGVGVKAPEVADPIKDLTAPGVSCTAYPLQQSVH